MKEQKLTSEEIFIKHYLTNENIKFIKQKKITHLNNDVKNYRVVDFYLPNLKVYIEYFGMYNSTKEIRNDYDKKAEVYIKNNLPTIFIYPHELGFLDYAFNSKMHKLLRLKKFKKKLYLFRYKLNRFFSKGKFKYIFNILFFLYLTIVFKTVDTGLTMSMNSLMFLISFVSLAYFIVFFIANLIAYFYFDE